jgi:hypothetical protein
MKMFMSGLGPEPPPGPPPADDPRARGGLLRACALVQLAHARAFMMPPEAAGTTLFSLNPKAFGYHAIPLVRAECEPGAPGVPPGLAPRSNRHVCRVRRRLLRVVHRDLVAN